jgi:ParB-like chromosome segregation protein Spo0J
VGKDGAVPQTKAGLDPSIGALRLPIAALKADPKNPRKMDDAARSGLAVSLETFGPLDIVFNDTTGELVSGHQRIAALKAAGAAEVVREGDLGHIAHPKTGERFPVRFVRWDATKQRMANIVANNPEIQGTFDERAIDGLRDLEQEVGFEELRLKALLEKMDAEAGVFDAGEVQPPELADGDRAPFRQMTFTVHDEQFEEIEDAITRAKAQGGGDSSVNENSNGNALAWICQRFNRG